MSEIVEVPINSEEIPEIIQPEPEPEPEPIPKQKPRPKGRPKGALGKKKTNKIPVNDAPKKKEQKRKSFHLQNQKKKKLHHPDKENNNNRCLRLMSPQTQRLLPRKFCTCCPIGTWNDRRQNEKSTGVGSYRNLH